VRSPTPGTVLLITLAVLSGCGGDRSSRPVADRPAGVAAVRLVPGPVRVEPTGTPGELSGPDREAVLAALATYVQDATLRPLAGRAPTLGTLSPDLAGVLDEHQRDALLDEGLPRTPGRPRVQATPVPLTALLDGDGRPALVGAALDVTVRAPLAGRGSIEVHRRGELVLRPVGGQWRIASFRLEVSRTPAGTPEAGGAR